MSAKEDRKNKLIVIFIVTMFILAAFTVAVASMID